MGVSAAVLAASAISAGTQVYSSAKASSQAQDLATQQKAQQDATLKQATDDQTNADATENANSVRDSQRQQIITNGLASQGRGGTILTSPLGVTGSSTSNSNKTLLGA